jgi:hypothetical protein
MRDQASQVDTQGHYIIMEQHQSSCVNLQYAGCTNVTHRSSHVIEATPSLQETHKSTRAETLIDKGQAIVDS